MRFMSKRNQIQKDAIKAKLVYEKTLEKIHSEIRARVKAAGLDYDKDEDIDGLVDIDMAVHAEYGYAEALKAHIDTEKALLEWGKSQVEANIQDYPEFAPRKADMLKVFEKAHLPSIHTKIVDLCLRLEP